MTDPAEPLDLALFDVPPGTRHPRTKIVLLTGPSGSGKSSLTRRVGMPVVELDDFYLDVDHPGLPHAFGIVDWDDPASWDGTAALAALREIATSGRAELPVYDIPSSRRTGTHIFDAGGAPLVIAEGIFAAELVAACRADGILADAICLARPRVVTFWFRLLRDVAESRKPLSTLLRRGVALFRDEPRLVKRWTALGCRALGRTRAEASLRKLVRDSS
ncbi:uridine kinase family protein [Myceligenerans salitolerans]|uniref:ATP-binding protein n=1 Tax=Myceligenerans salitolerans TaxID=1230528 RepID=A0ABS3I8H7_9MICO|nr:ATP-binding protein [Myceligenerans salitolerans]MBO0609327.1 ATP-binding protein [Myceligenerans salitolerans]